MNKMQALFFSFYNYGGLLVISYIFEEIEQFAILNFAFFFIIERMDIAKLLGEIRYLGNK